MRRVGVMAVAPAGALLTVAVLVALQVQGTARGWPWPVQAVLWSAFFASRDDRVQRLLGGGSLRARTAPRTVLGSVLGLLAVCSTGAPELAPVMATLVTAVHLQWSTRWSLATGVACTGLSVPVALAAVQLGWVVPLAGPYAPSIALALMGLGLAITGNLAALTVQQEAAQERLARAQELREQLLRRAADHDALTGLLSRAAVTARLRSEAAVAAPGHATAVLFCDLDGFKAVNDGHGHAAGDALLVEVAQRLTALVGATGAVGRVGGDEFVVVLGGLEGPAAAHEVAAAVRDGLDGPVVVGGAAVRAGVSVGVAVATRPTGVDELLDAADAAMYADKAARRAHRQHERRGSAVEGAAPSP